MSFLQLTPESERAVRTIGGTMQNGEGDLPGLGLRIMEPRFPVDRPAVDFVALDARGSLVLVVVGLVADSRMFLRSADVYWWCREHTEVVRTLFPAARISADQP